MEKLLGVKVIMKKESLRFSDIEYPQLTRLPRGFHFVRQNGSKQFYGFSKGGRLILHDLGQSISKVRKNALAGLNAKLRWTKMVWGKICRIEDYEKAIS